MHAVYGLPVFGPAKNFEAPSSVPVLAQAGSSAIYNSTINILDYIPAINIISSLTRALLAVYNRIEISQISLTDEDRKMLNTIFETQITRSLINLIPIVNYINLLADLELLITQSALNKSVSF